MCTEFWLESLKRHLEGTRHRLEEINTMDVKEIWWGGMQWSQMAQNRDNWLALNNPLQNQYVSIFLG
jgi:hypothetical protein